MYSYILVGGGLQNGLLALALLARDPTSRIALVEKASRLGGNHTWCFHAEDVPADVRDVVEPLVVHRWSGYEVAFPELRRVLDTPYAAVTSERLDQVVRARMNDAPGCDLLLSATAVEVGARQVRLDDGRVLTGELVVDARGPGATSGRMDENGSATGYQKFVGLEVTLRRPHDRQRPLLMDATVAQTDGFHFLYTLPFGPERLLLEDTYFSDTPALDREASVRAIHAYAAAQGHEIERVVREERGVLPLPWDGAHEIPTEGPLRAGYQGGWYHPVTGYSFPVAMRLALYVASTPIPEAFGPGLQRLARAHARQVKYGHRLNKMLFQWFAPEDRYNVLERFYRLPEGTIRRFYALMLTAGDRARIVMGKPPRGLSLRAMLTGRSTS